jgi:transposase-like protein
MAVHGIRKSLEDVSTELKGIKIILSAIWHSKYQTGETDRLNPEMFADEYISTEECAKRLGISDQTIRNWIAQGKKSKGKGWIEGIHYVNITPEKMRKAVIRIPWTQLVKSFSKTKEVDMADFYGVQQYQKPAEQPV